MTTGRTIPAMVRELASRVDAAARLAEEARTARGAVNLMVVAAYRLAATAADGEAAHAGKVGALRAFVASTEPARRPFHATLIDAALAAEAEDRIARGVPVLGRRFSGWMEAPASEPPPSAEVRATDAGAPSPLPRSLVEACAEAAALDDVDAVLLRTLTVTRALRAAAERGGSGDALLDDYEEAALALCVAPPTSGVDDARWLLVHQWTLLRRRRPLAAAVVRARVRWARKARMPS